MAGIRVRKVKRVGAGEGAAGAAGRGEAHTAGKGRAAAAGQGRARAEEKGRARARGKGPPPVEPRVLAAVAGAVAAYLESEGGPAGPPGRRAAGARGGRWALAGRLELMQQRLEHTTRRGLGLR